MQRWNGWGEESLTYPLSPTAIDFLKTQLDSGHKPRDATLAEVINIVPPTRLPDHNLVVTNALDRLLHSRGQSLPDWIAKRGGQIPVFPDGVVYPSSHEDVRNILNYAKTVGASVIPYGGGTSVVGHINSVAGDTPVLVVDLKRMSQLRYFDEKNHLATFGAGIKGPQLEAELRGRNRTLGHFPQSFEFSSLGGWIAARSAGQQSLYYGRLEDLFGGGVVETPSGKLILPPFPASAAGPDLREMILGSEGRIGIITEATVRLSQLPAAEVFYGVFFPNFEYGLSAIREISQAKLSLSLMRLNTSEETRATLALSAHTRIVHLLEQILSLIRIADEKCLMLLGATGHQSTVKKTLNDALDIARHHKGVNIGEPLGKEWKKSRFRTPYLRNSLWELGYATDTLETATSWTNLQVMILRIEGALRGALDNVGEKVYTFAHISHSYSTGCNLYITFLYRIADRPEETLRRWKILKSAASEAIVLSGGTISHQHGVGLDHRKYLHSEKGDLGLLAIKNVLVGFDPTQMMNPGKLL